METWFTPFDAPPAPHDVAGRFPSPFDEQGPQVLARRAAEQLQAELRAGHVAPGIPAALLDSREGGKMFGVLVVRAPDGRLGFLRAFSAMLAGRWDVPGFVPPLFEREARARLEPEGEALVKALHGRAEELRTAPELVELRVAREAQQARHAAERAAMRARHDERRKQRHARRAALAEAERAALHALDQESRGDKAEVRRLDAAQEEERLALASKLKRLERRLGALERLRRIVSRAFMKRLHDTYVVPNARGEHRPLRALFTSGEPPSGAADCAAPKLLAHAYRLGLQPIALAEFWWGAPPPSGGRVSGAFYAACRDKCGPLLPFMLEGLSVAPPRAFAPPAPTSEGLSILFEDEWLVVVDKPHDLLSVPGREASLTDSVLTRLRARYPHATGPLLVHRLDLDTSGLLVAALDARTHATLQRQFLHREVHKRYVAWVQGLVKGERGTIDFPMRVDLDDRPRQIHDPVHGKRAVTEWQVLERRGERTRVAFFPHTGRTHQLRVHAAHPLGLGAPIVGDRLYGHPGERLFLHAEALTFLHPGTGERVSFELPAPF
ncbi:RluA family pseudouridine synthase [Pyxidicoccus parkwayensis]|uniref:RluA family pseudouridine synthase n=1 Tax=Pyxidicoccus parkwayensis TaxID=2813578 RepID=A0ABX7NX88_9BACT|nr:RluA family pseudouridine synthase [Pyxidicoccus parkwaysis]QSQ23489.1 RluA family pseudouridine synthase [Pyxidicoccus parkwaysis]